MRTLGYVIDPAKILKKPLLSHKLSPSDNSIIEVPLNWSYIQLLPKMKSKIYLFSTFLEKFSTFLDNFSTLINNFLTFINKFTSIDIVLSKTINSLIVIRKLTKLIGMAIISSLFDSIQFWNKIIELNSLWKKNCYQIGSISLMYDPELPKVSTCHKSVSRTYLLPFIQKKCFACTLEKKNAALMMAKKLTDGSL